MADVAIFQEERVETFARRESRFEQTGSKAIYCLEFASLFPAVREETGNITFNVSDVARLMGIRTPVFLSGGRITSYNVCYTKLLRFTRR